MSSSDQSPSHNVFVYGSFQEPAVVGLILECTPVIVSAQLHGFHRYRLKGRLHPCIAPLETGVIDGKEWKLLHMEKFIEASEKFIEWKKNPDGRSREEFAKFVEEDPPVA
ncbi:hypothetical protein BRARA_F03116 [Brassica rapa]|uniref:Putative gamma-glutamylcyclotransferase n=1 Tax=Brassica campestris TaxID=3711 RepID=A0A397Z2X6_BRACM|nr:hypothetical protein BRARA_F03116 [Brassica rapa]